MSPAAVQRPSGTFRAEPGPSTFAFAVRHSDTFWFRGVLPDVTATLRAEGDALILEGSARVESISVVEPAALRTSLLPRSPSNRPRSASPTRAGPRSTVS